MTEVQKLKKGGDWPIRYLIAAVLSALLISHMHSPLTHKASGKVAIVATPTVYTIPKPAAVTPPVTPPVSVEVASYAYGCSTYDSTFRLYAWNVAVAEAICQAESSGDPYAHSWTDDYGLMQLHDEEIYNPWSNIAGAYRKYLAQGWEAWTTYNTGAYKKYL
jgi:soluble lytic murein transglycosylase-like protein